MTPFEKFTGVKPDLSNIRVFGCKVFTLNEDESRSKLDARAIPGIFLGYAEQSKAYLVYQPQSDKLVRSRDVKFLEDQTWLPRLPTPTLDLKTHEDRGCEQAPPQHTNQEKDESSTTYTNNPESNKGEDESSPTQSSNTESNRGAEEQSHSTLDNTHSSMNKSPTFTRSGRLSKFPRIYEEYDMEEPLEEIYTITSNHNPLRIPKPTQAIRIPGWHAAMQKEINSMAKNGVYLLVPRTPEMRVVRSQWILKWKTSTDGPVEKARIVANGSSQTQGIDHQETYAPVVKSQTLRVAFSLAAARSYRIKQRDIATAYLNAALKEEVYMAEPLGFQTTGANGIPMVWKLLKSLYGLRQSGRNWNECLDEALLDFGMTRSKWDPCLYTINIEGKHLMLIIYVDDIMIFFDDDTLWDSFEKFLNSTFDNTDSDTEGSATILGINYNVDSQQGKIHLHQGNYIKQMLAIHNMQDCHQVTTPSVSRPLDDEASKPITNIKEHQQMFGSLSWLATTTRPDIAHAVSKIGQTMANPTNADHQAIKRVFRYLKGTMDLGPTYLRNQGEKSSTSVLIGYADADFAGALDRRSNSGFVFILNGSAISWISKRQGCVALSTTEAEYMSASTATQEAIFLRGILKDMGEEQLEPTLLYQDNQSTMALANNYATSNRSKHIDVKYHHIRESIATKQVRLEFISTKDMIADCLTKSVPAFNLKQATQVMFGK
eukprot:TRINITY_DN2307_c0_g1_i1.p2 TRINITY_DN2307_c0_g1~~TRINITY_DN2307_c0_g1_i1.p2  ORF type:complete len:715 (-),score=157.74 TRINITY_DN2307_c0_g1_i1:143-2287(-)